MKKEVERKKGEEEEEREDEREVKEVYNQFQRTAAAS